MSLYSYNLEIEKYKDQICDIVQKNQSVIIKGPTGCGKSTYIPYLFKTKKVAIIEPRRIAVTSIYKILEPHIPDLGYKMRFNKKINKNTKMTIFTDGCFLNEIDDLDYDVIIIDEVHERSIRTDLILSILKSRYKNKLILMSATVDIEKLSKYFGASILNIECKSYPVEIKYLDEPTSDYLIEAYLTIKKILKNRDINEKKDILVFLPGEEDISELFQMCKKIVSISVYKMHSSISDDEQKRIFLASNLTKVILSTNICETSITIPNIKYVIDTGLTKVKYFEKINYFGIQAINRNSESQRLGRCNRTGPGICYRLYSEFQVLSSPLPEIVRSDPTTMLIHIIKQKQNIFTFDFLDYPSAKNMIYSIIFLIEKNIVNVFNGNQKIENVEEFVSKLINFDHATSSEYLQIINFRLTDYGHVLISHPFDVHFSHFYQQCIINNVSFYGSLLLSMISQENYTFLTSPKKIETKSDIIYLVEVMQKYLDSENKIKFCNEYNLPIKGMEMAERIFKSLNKTGKDEIIKFEMTFSKAFCHNLCLKNKDSSYKMKRNDLEIFIHPTSGFFKRNDRKIVVVDIFIAQNHMAELLENSLINNNSKIKLLLNIKMKK